MGPTNFVKVTMYPFENHSKSLSSDPTVLHQCLSNQFVDNNILSDFVDGSVYRNCVKSGDLNSRYLSLILYEDAFEVANPLGSAKVKHNVMGFYYILGNIESHNRSAINHIQLVMLAMEADLNKVGQPMFRRVVDDLRS